MQPVFVALLVFMMALQFKGSVNAQIWAPEGLNMPGTWNSWSNPPSNLAFASSTQISGGRVSGINTGTPRYQTGFSVGVSDADIVGGTYTWLFTSGSTGNPWNNKWADVSVSMNNLQPYTFNSGSDNQITVVNGKWYTMNWEDSGYNGTRAIFMETSAQPVDITAVTPPTLAPAGSPIPVTLNLSGLKSAEEIIYLRYSTDGWLTSGIIQASITGSSGTAEIPGQSGGTIISCYVLSSTVSGLSSDFDLQTIKFNNNGGANYIIPIGNPSINWANLQWPGSKTIEPGQPFNVFGQVWIDGLTGGLGQAPGLQAWVGYSTDNTNPATWTNWIAAEYAGASGSNDEFVANIGTSITVRDTYYYATRFKLNNQDYIYGGFSSETGGFWDGTNNINGILTVGYNIDCGVFNGIVSTDPTFPFDNQPVTVYFNSTVGNGALLNYTGDVYAHTGVITNLSTGPDDWKYTKTIWGQNTPETLLTRISANLYSLTLSSPRSYYNVPSGETIKQLVFVFRNAEIQPGGSYLEHRNSDGTDLYTDIYEPMMDLKFINPVSSQTILDQNTEIPVCVEALLNNTLNLYINDDLLVQENSSSLSYMLIMQQLNPGINWLKAVASDGNSIVKDSVQIYLRGPIQVADLPAGITNGINYMNDSTVTLVLHDPAGLKQFVYVIGEFNNWQLSDENYMKRTPDGKRYWVTLTGLQPGLEYAFQYLIDGNLKIADPYSEKILDPWNDQWISSSNYPDLKPYPGDKTTGVVSIFNTNSEEYQWQVPDFTPSALNNTQSDLIIYEMHIRDFVDSHSINEAKEKLSYLKELGVNAVQLMPVAEFDGNDSWGFSPNFFFATDKAYGTQMAYKEFIDAAHQRGIAVILDIVPNHAFGLNPMVQMYFDPNAGGYGQPSGNNPWLNGQSPHPYSVGYDFNHESPYTRQFFKDVFGYWLSEFKVDGFRIDLSKGLTQNYSGNDIGSWNAYDQSRINILTDYYNHIKWVNPDAYVILEHFANNDEETVLANTGMMLWSAMHNNYKQVAMGWQSSSDVSWAFHGNRGWNYPNLIDYMESHDEERMMYEALSNGNSSGSYNVRDTLTALHHQEQALVLHLGIPGPKMLWQFQELGYDYSIFYGGSRPSPKPTRWDYLDNPAREKLNRVISGMASLRKSDVFRYGNFTSELGGMGKRIWITHPSMDVVISVNMDVTGFDMAPGFTKTGTWYDYFSGESFNVTDAAGHFFFFGPGDYRVFTSEPLPKPYHNLQITVLDSETGNPIEGVSVRLSNAGNHLTGTDGKTSFLSLSGTVSLTVDKFEWISQTTDVTLTGNTNLTIEMEPGWDPASGWANLQHPGSGQMNVGQDYTVFSQVWINGVTDQTLPVPGIEAWIGFSNTDTDPSTWTNWVVASYSTSNGNNDEYMANIGPEIAEGGIYYYVSRFRFNSGNFVYGGYSSSGGGFWDGIENVSGILNVDIIPPAVINWANLQWPESGQITTGQNFTIYAQAWIDGITGQPTPAPGLEAWIGYSNTNSNPSTWINWIPASYNLPVGNNDEFQADLGSQINSAGTWFYASRFRLSDGSFVYGGYSPAGGGFWNGTGNNSGLLTVNSPAEKTLNLTLFLEGLYNSNGLMRQANDETGPRYASGIADQITVELHDQNDYNLVVFSSTDVFLGINGLCTVTLPSTLSGSYFITIKHRNSVETTSALPVSFSIQMIPYSFNAVSGAFENNLLHTPDGRYVIYGGDVDQNGAVDIADFTPVDNDQSNFVTGYVLSDVNGDGTVDIGDFSIIDNNQVNFIRSMHP